MITDIVARAKKLLPHLDWPLFRDSSVLTIGAIFARGLGFLITMLLARYFVPAEFGLIQYAISVGTIISMGVQPFGQHVLSRYVGMYRNDQAKLREYMSNIWALSGILFGVSLVLAVTLLSLLGKFNFGILAIFGGTSIFYLYYGLARGFLASGKLVAVDVGNNILQVFLIVLLLQFFDIRSTLLAMLIRGLSPIIPAILLQKFWPLPNAFEIKLINRDTAVAILKFFLPVWLSHASYMIYATIAVLFLEHFTDAAMVGVFSLAATMGIALSFFPSGLATLLMPKIASAPDRQYRSLLAGALGLVLLSDIVLIGIYYFFGPWFIDAVFGNDYLVFPEIFALMAVVETFGGVHTVLTSAYIGRGLAQEETKSRVVTVLATFLGCWLLIPSYGVIGAVYAKLIGILCGLAAYAFMHIQNKLRLHDRRFSL
jgi:O-antigen/teichoic acid export membrane protein